MKKQVKNMEKVTQEKNEMKIKWFPSGYFVIIGNFKKYFLFNTNQNNQDK